MRGEVAVGILDGEGAAAYPSQLAVHPDDSEFQVIEKHRVDGLRGSR